MPSLNLAQQGVILVVALLVCEFAFVGTLIALLAQTENEARRQDFAREVTSKASRLLLVMYDTGDAVGKFTASRALGSTERYKAGLEELPEMVSWLKDNLKGTGEPERLIAHIDQNLQVCAPVIDGIKRDAESMTNQEALKIWRERRMPIQRNVDEMVVDLEKLMAYGRAIEDEAPSKERAQRMATRSVLWVGLGTNIIFFIVMILFFTRKIARRLDVVGDNVKRLESGAPLNELLTGSDEIAEVDRAFHETADAVRREEALLKESETRLRTILESVPIGVVVLDAEEAIQFTNKAISKSFAYEQSELLGHHFSMLLPEETAQSSQTKIQELLTSALGRISEITARRKDGALFPADFSLAEVKVGDKTQHIAMLLDATERHELQKLRLSFVNMIREELRTPLTLIDTFFSEYRSGQFGDVNQEAGEGTDKAQKNIKRLLLLLNDLFDLERLESGKIEINPADCALGGILERSIDGVSSLAQKRKVSIEVESTDLTVFADADRIVQVIINFLSNAIKFSPENSIVRVALAALASDNSDQIEIAVIDQGRGIPEDRIGLLFQQFQQVEAKDGTEKGGTGLGLAICKAIVEEHGGTVGVTSKEGQGSKFWLTLPLRTGTVGDEVAP